MNNTVSRKPLAIGALSLLLAAPSLARQASAQAEYRNLDAGFPIRIEDATVTERYALDLDLANMRFDALSAGRKRLELEPTVSYGILPRTEVWLRVPTYYREATISPRRGIAGVGFGSMYQLTLETLHLPAMAIASEVFVPTGPNALPASYSLKTAFTRSFTPGRLHFNASVASYPSRTVPTNCLPLIQGTVCPGPGTVGPPLPPLDGPCAMSPIESNSYYQVNAVQQPTLSQSVFTLPAPLVGHLVTHAHWLLGVGADKALPLSSIVFLGDVFAERFEGIGRSTDWTAELGARKQLNPHVILVGSVGRHARGTNESSFFILGATFSRALQLFGSGG
jgi:hypothetical protein